MNIILILKLSGSQYAFPDTIKAKSQFCCTLNMLALHAKNRSCRSSIQHACENTSLQHS